MNGMISYSGDESPDNRPVATMATYTCNPNYTLNGGSIRTCGSDGVWSGSPPMCQGIGLVHVYLVSSLMLSPAMQHMYTQC